MSKTTTLSKLKRGEYFRFPGTKKVYTYTGKAKGHFTYEPADDISSGFATKADRAVEIGFTY